MCDNSLAPHLKPCPRVPGLFGRSSARFAHLPPDAGRVDAPLCTTAARIAPHHVRHWCPSALRRAKMLLYPHHHRRSGIGRSALTWTSSAHRPNARRLSAQPCIAGKPGSQKDQARPLPGGHAPSVGAARTIAPQSENLVKHGSTTCLWGQLWGQLSMNTGFFPGNCGYCWGGQAHSAIESQRRRAKLDHTDQYGHRSML